MRAFLFCGEPFGLIRRQATLFARVMDYLSTPLANSLPSLSETKTLCRKAETKNSSRKAEVKKFSRKAEIKKFSRKAEA